MIKMLLAIYLVSWVSAFTMFRGTPIEAIKKSVALRGVRKTIIFFMILPLQFLVSFLEKIAEVIENFINYCMK